MKTRLVVTALAILFILCVVIVIANNFLSLHHARALDPDRQEKKKPTTTPSPPSSSARSSFSSPKVVALRHVGGTADDNKNAESAAAAAHHPTVLLPPLLIDKPAAASLSCPLPQLHPEKFESMMHWGVRKTFPSCQHKRGNFSRVERRYGARGHALYNRAGSEHVSVLVSRKMCGGKPHVFEFGELADSDFTRMSSVMDAETRQNALRDRFKNPHEFAKSVHPLGGGGGDDDEIEFRLSKPYVVVECGNERSLHITAPKSKHHHHHKKDKKKKKKNHKGEDDENDGDEENSNKPSSSSSSAASTPPGGFQNILHFMWDSTSIHAFRRSAKKTKRYLEELHNDPESPSHVFGFKHLHSVSCCSPGNQIPWYSGVMNGEGDPFVRSEPHADSSDWLWNQARELGFKTFWSLDNCPDKSARDYHAFPRVDSRVVAPICLAGVLLSHKERACLGGKTVDEQVLDGLADWWRQKENRDARKFAAIQFISPHEETEKQLIEVDALVSRWMRDFFDEEELSKTLVVLWSDHGINFGKYAASHDGEIEKMFPFGFLIVPKRGRHAPAPAVLKSLQAATERLVTPYDMFETVRALMHLPQRPAPKMVHDAKHNPPLPRPQESHIMASFQRQIVPLDLTMTFAAAEDTAAAAAEDRSCIDANIPVEFCSCLAWIRVDEIAASTQSSAPLRSFLKQILHDVLLSEHRRLLSNHSGVCHEVRSAAVESVDVQLWPIEYKPKMKETAKRVWMKPNRDFVKIRYTTNAVDGDDGSGGVFVGVVSIKQGLLASSSSLLHMADGGQHDDDDQQQKHSMAKVRATSKLTQPGVHAQLGSTVLDVIRLDRMDAMKKKCGIVQKVPEQLCICK